ncbi:hypothetical protein Y032_0129g1502 [Ancylostoma ceylanicum]|nr:hypothetical protein Y032_0129g1502 [Ancylostoma ceylanicum]
MSLSLLIIFALIACACSQWNTGPNWQGGGQNQFGPGPQVPNWQGGGNPWQSGGQFGPGGNTGPNTNIPGWQGIGPQLPPGQAGMGGNTWGGQGQWPGQFSNQRTQKSIA